MTHRRGHATHLAVLSLHQFQGNPPGGHGFSKADGGSSRRDGRLRLQTPGPAGKRFSSDHHNPPLEFGQGGGRRNALDLHPVLTLMRSSRVKQTLVQVPFIAQQKQTLGVRVQAADGINVPGKSKLRQRAVRRAIRRELGQNPERFVERQEHGGDFVRQCLPSPPFIALAGSRGPAARARPGFPASGIGRAPRRYAARAASCGRPASA